MAAPRLDSHVHFWRHTAAEFGWLDGPLEPLRRDFLPADLAEPRAAAGIDGAIAVQARQSHAETQFLLELAAATPWLRGVVGWVDLRAADVPSQLRPLQRSGLLVGVRHVVEAEPDPEFVVGEAFLRGIAALAPYDLVYDLLVQPRHWPSTLALVERFPGQKFVLDHAGKPDPHGDLDAWRRWLHALAKSPNVACKLSGWPREAGPEWTAAALRPLAATVLDAFGPERVLFGSDWPVCQCASTYGRWVEAVAAWLSVLAPTEQDAVWGGNAQRLYALPRRR